MIRRTAYPDRSNLDKCDVCSPVIFDKEKLIRVYGSEFSAGRIAVSAVKNDSGAEYRNRVRCTIRG